MEKQDSKIIITCGEGDFYSVELTFDIKDAFNMCIRDISNINFENYNYQVLVSSNNNGKFHNRLSELQLGGYYKKYLKYKIKYYQLAKKIIKN